MSWLNLNQSLNSLKGQITNFASEVLSESAVEDISGDSPRTDSSVKDLEMKCRNQELEIEALKQLNTELEAALQSERLSRRNGVKEEESNWYWDPPPPSKDSNKYELQIQALQNEISTLKQQEKINPSHDETEETRKLKEEVSRLVEDNKNLASNLEDLDYQHQQAMERLLTLKKELQKNFEVLKQEHEELKNSNDEYSNEREVLLAKISERDKEIKELKELTEHKPDYESLHHKFINLERIHSNLKENAEKFQEENQDLHEEIFKLQEQVTKYEHELELAIKNSETSNMVPRESYEVLMKELNDLKDQKNADRIHFEETNIDDNAKSVIESLKREIRELKHQLSQKENDLQLYHQQKVLNYDTIMKLYKQYVNFELPVDYVGDMPSTDDNIVLSKLENSFKALSALKRDVDTLEQKLSEKKHEVEEMEVQIFDLTNENDFLSADILQFQSDLKEMKKNNDFLINEIAALKNTSKLEPILEGHEENVAKLESELEDCNKINTTFASKIRIIEKELADVKAEKVFLQDSLKDMRDKYTTMLNELDTFKTKSTAIEEFEHGTISEHTNKLKQAIDEIDDLKRKLTAANAKNEQLSIDIHIIENDKVLLTKELDDLKNSFTETNSAHKDAENVKQSLEHKLEGVERKLDEVLKNKLDLENNKRLLEEKLSVLEQKAKAFETINEELERARNDKFQLSGQMDLVLKENMTLKDTISKLSTDITSLELTESELKNENEKLKIRNVSDKDTSSLQSTIENLTAKVINQETLSQEVTTLKEEKQHLIEQKLHLESQLTSTDAKIARLEEEFYRVIEDLNEKDSIIDKMNATFSENTSKINSLNELTKNLNTTLDVKNQEIVRLTQHLQESEAKLNELSFKSNRGFEELKQLEHEKAELNKQILELNEEINSKNIKLSELEELCHEYKVTIGNKDKEIKELNQSIVELTDKIKTADNYSHLNDEYANLLKEKETIEKELTNLKNFVLTKELELTDVKTKMQQLEKTVEDYKNIVEIAAKEKTELINLINLKHNESIQYHNEIQRLNHVVLEQTNEYKRIIEEKDTLLQNISPNCSNCENLRITLKEKDEIIMTLNQNITEYERLKTELLRANDTVVSLKERCENLDKSLAIQLDTVKRLTAENVQLSEKEQNSTRELERLRRHLVEMEDNYTQELMTSEQKLTECQTRLHQIEERAKQTSTVYTSNSIRANQEVETLRNQIKLLEKQREDVQAKLSEAEDARSRSEAALTNLQVVLEQFQSDKERDIHAATEKIRNKMDGIIQQNVELQNEIARLNNKLEEALAGLQAASRLGDQVESKTAQINDLKEQVRTLQISVAAAEERYYNATSNQQDKVDKNLVKNLVINYVLTAAQNTSNKTQVLRILSTVLDFNQKECERLGLVRSSGAPDSLAMEFIKFLQNESKPRTPLPNMMGIAQNNSRSNTPSSRKNSSVLAPSNSPLPQPGHQRTPSTGSNNLLFQNLDALETSSQVSIESERSRRTLETGVTQPRDTEGAILKHVLRDM